jgi:hypothetical protein
MLKRLAIWYLRKTKVSVILNCHFDKRIDIGMANKVHYSDSSFIDGTIFKHESGNEFVLRKVD